MKNVGKGEEKILKEKISDFIREYKNTKLSEIFLDDIIKALEGITEQSSKVAQATKDRIIGRKILEDEIFETIYTSFTNKSAEKVSAFALDGLTYFRESTPLEIFLKEYVHEGTHILDDFSKIGNNIEKLKKETGLIIHEGEIMQPYIKNLNKKQLIEFRARIFEREFEIASNMDLEFKSISDLIKFIKKHY